MNWPPSDEIVISYLSQDESPLLEFKQDWYDLSDGNGKAVFTKDILAIANCTQPDGYGILILGREDKSKGGKIVGIDQMPDPDRISQILTSYTMPVPDVRVHHTWIQKKRIGILGIFWTPEHPYFANRDVEKVLSSWVVYTRRGATNAVLRPFEFINMIRMRVRVTQ